MSVPGSPAWRATHAAELLAFGRRSARPGGGFGWLDDSGRIDAARGQPLWITARMTHVFSLAALAGVDGALDLAHRGVSSIAGDFADAEFGGWFTRLDDDGAPEDSTKANYEHAFVLLCSSSAAVAGVPGGADLFQAAGDVVAERFWRADEGRSGESWDRSFSTLEAYRGANSNMHSVEAYLAAADVSGDPRWRERALSIATRLIDVEARAREWRIPEHFDPQWRPLPDYNLDRPEDPFRPYGATPGHGMEWARLLLDLDAALPEPPGWLVEAALALFDRAVGDGWRADDHPGFVYTVDWTGRPVTTTRMHWVMTEAVLAADALYRRTGEERIAEIAASWWYEIDAYFVDRTAGSWHHELDTAMSPSSTTWSGKPDIYHAYQACLLPSLPQAPSAAVALSQAAGE